LTANLYLSTIPQHFNADTDRAIGPWCFVGAEDVCPDWDQADFVEPFESLDEIDEADRDTRALANELALGFARRLNDRHAREYSNDFWRSLLILWLVAGIQTCWRRYRHIECFIDRHRTEDLRVEIADGRYPIRPSSLNEFMDLLLYTPGFDWWISSGVLKRLAPANWQLVDVPVVNDLAVSDEQQLGLIRRNPLSRILARQYQRMPFNSVQGTRLTRLFFSALLLIAPRHTCPLPVRATDPSVETRFPPAFLDFLEDFLDQTLPEAYLADFAGYETHARKFSYSPGRMLIDHVAPQAPADQLVVASAIESGERLVGYQHGAMDGNSRATPWSEAEKQYYGWITWGWSEQQDIAGRMVPLPSPYLTRFRNKYRARNNDLILVGAKIFLRGNRFDSVPTPAQYLQYRRSKLTFIGALPGKIRQNTAYRPFVRSLKTLEDEEYVKAAFPDLRIVHGDLHPRVMSCRLLVLDSPSTTLNIAMAANIPTICYWNPDHWPQCRQIRPYFERFEKAGMLFSDATEAAQQVAAVWDDVPGWWNSNDIQQIRHDWSGQYARTSPIWWWHWARTIWSLSRERAPFPRPKLHKIVGADQ
jgi:putative transferase (TIGR04331 family)